jgi:hypothetical protein
MDPLSQRMLENILTAQVLLLSVEIEQRKRKVGTNRPGGDFTKEAIQEIKQKREGIIRQLLID